MVRNDDMDLNKNCWNTFTGGNGDYYIGMWIEDDNGNLRPHSVRIAMSGGVLHNHIDVRMALVNLYREMEKAGLNDFHEINA